MMFTYVQRVEYVFELCSEYEFVVVKKKEFVCTVTSTECVYVVVLEVSTKRERERRKPK
jgi:hypothetical protein